jgi:cytochrome c5
MSNMTDREFTKSFSMMIGVLVALAVVIFIVANVIGGHAKKEVVGANDTQNADLIARIEPVGKLVAAQSVVSASVPTAQAGESGDAVYHGTCFACHGTGVLGAPKFGDKASWAPHIAKGKATLYKHALHGFKAMPAKGGNSGLTDAEVKAAVDYMISKSH